MQNHNKAIFTGLGAALLLLLFYFVTMMLLSRSWDVTISQFESLWYWIIALSTGFGIQVGLYVYLKELIKDKRQISQSGAITVTSTGTSAVGMVACCAHHATEILPIIGLSGASIFLARYQIQLIILGIIMNFFGILYMLKIIKKASN